MSKKHLVSLVLLLALAGSVAADTNWSDVVGDGLWGTADNWTNGLPSVNNGWARLFVIPGPTILVGEAAAVPGGGIHLGGAGEGNGQLNMRGGTLDCGGINCGWKTYGEINLYDGTITASGAVKIARDSGSSGVINLYGGTINAPSFNMHQNDENNDALLNVASGVMILAGNDQADLRGYIDEGIVVAYNGNGTLSLDYDVTNTGATTLSATHHMNPSPANNSIALPGALTLSWTPHLDPCEPGQPILYDVYMTDDIDALLDFTDPESMLVASQIDVNSVTVTTELKKRYFWAVDTYIGSENDPVIGSTFNFTADNAPPQVDAGASISTFLQEGTRSGVITGVVTDDGVHQPFTTLWTALEQPSDDDPNLPSIVIEDPNALQTTVTVAAEGTYVLQLEAYDGEYTGTDVMNIVVHPDDWK
jgi:hypothetical protein